MSSDDLIQKSLFGNDSNLGKIDQEVFSSDSLSDDSLEKNAENRPRLRKKISENKCVKSDEGLHSENNNSILEKSFSFKSVQIEKLPPVLKHYVILKKENNHNLLLYRLGDFFECFFEDAIIISETLEITLTSKDGGKEIGKVPMAGIPHHALERYCSELIKKNYSVIICDQLEKSSGKYGTPIKRGITRIITPGTVIEEGMLVARQNNWITAVFIEETKYENDFIWGISRADVSTGELITIEGQNISKLSDELIKLEGSETIIGSEEEKEILINFNKKIKCKVTEKTDFSYSEATEIIKKFYEVNTIEGLGIKDLICSTKSLGGLLFYLRKINPSATDCDSSVKISLDFPSVKFPKENLIIDYQTKKNLELIQTQRESNYIGTLLWSIDRTYTSMGARCLRRWLETPLLNVKEISKRQNVICNFLDSKQLRKDTQNQLRAMGDLERLAGRACAGQASPRDLIAISEGLKKLPRLKSIIDRFKNELPCWINNLKKSNFELLKLADTISDKLVESPPLNISEGGIIHDGIDNVLDGLRNIIDDYANWLNNEEIKERKLSKITNLRINFHRNFGYYISINKSKVKLAPNHWIKRQTLTNEERYVTSSIKSQESKIFQVKNKAALREYEIFCEIRNLVASKTKEIRTIAKSIASLDALLGLAITSVENNFKKPQIIAMDISDPEQDTNIKNGRNPIVEQLLDDKQFVPNDILFNENQKMIILTGPNASGKSCFIRQVGLIQILAQIGCYVPCEFSKIKIVDRIFTRVGAVDDQSTGQSTFMVEMSETASILNQATRNSLVLLDEIGRGTSTFDGLSIAWSVSEYLANQIMCKTIFATHYHELNFLQNSQKNVSNFQVTVKKRKDKLEFCHKIEKGGSNKSYGIEAARLAGVPTQVVRKAQQILDFLEKSNTFKSQINIDTPNNHQAA
tara:strand:+ start:967 stop:3738 length:2772 start_codon:yes stop_codon:yes gene_type:complete